MDIQTRAHILPRLDTCTAAELLIDSITPSLSIGKRGKTRYLALFVQRELVRHLDAQLLVVLNKKLFISLLRDMPGNAEGFLYIAGHGARSIET